jgi:hypothetical protein
MFARHLSGLSSIPTSVQASRSTLRYVHLLESFTLLLLLSVFLQITVSHACIFVPVLNTSKVSILNDFGRRRMMWKVRTTAPCSAAIEVSSRTVEMFIACSLNGDQAQ